MSFQPTTYEEAKTRFKPLRRSQIRSVSQKPDPDRKPPTAHRIKRSKPLGKKSRRAKKPTVGQLKKNAWKEFSIYIRLKYANELGEVQCVTCDKWLRAWEFRTRKGDVLELPGWKAAQAGHFVPGRTSAVLFDERNTHPQCGNCNVYLHGNLIAYFPFMQRTYGQDVIDELIQLKDQTHKWAGGELEGLIEKYKALNESNPLVEN
jgi:hypothetical protein